MSRKSASTISRTKSSKVTVDFHRLHVLNDPDQVRRIRHVAVVQKKPHTRQMRILAKFLVKMVDAGGIERRRAPFDAVHDVAFVEQELGPIRAVLTGRPGNECNAICHKSLPSPDFASEQKGCD